MVSHLQLHVQLATSRRKHVLVVWSWIYYYELTFFSLFLQELSKGFTMSCEDPFYKLLPLIAETMKITED